MAYENVQFAYNNFCLGSRIGAFCSIDTTNATAILRAKNDEGDSLDTYNLSPTITQGVSIKSLEYTGPRGLPNFYDGLRFFTLEQDSDTQCTVKIWDLDDTGSTLNLCDTITKTTVSGGDSFNCTDMAVEYYHTTFLSDVTTGTGVIPVSSTAHMEIGDDLLLGPSSDADNLYAFEHAQITNIVGNNVYITVSGTTPTENEYVSGDTISFYKYIYLFSSEGVDRSTASGTLFKIDAYDGSVIERDYNGVYADVTAAAWDKTTNYIGFVKGTSLFYIDPYDTYMIQKSHALTNVEADEITIIPVYDLIFDSTSIYRLQQKITIVNDSGIKTTTTWTTYNYHVDTTVPYTKSISLSTSPDGILMNSGQVTINATVRDQFGVGLLGKTVYFSRTGDAGGSFTPANGQSVTNSDGDASIIYTAAYYDPASDFNGEKISMYAETDGASISTGSTYVWSNTTLLLKNRYESGDGQIIIQMPTSSGTPAPSHGSPLYCEISVIQVEGITSTVSIIGKSKFQFPGGDWGPDGRPSTPSAALIKQLEDLEGELSCIQIAEVSRDLGVKQVGSAENDLQVSQTYTSRHYLTANTDTAEIDQFRFIEEAIPAFWSEKNPVSTNIWIRLRPPVGYSLDNSTTIFKVKEVSYAGDTGYIDVTSLSDITTFDAGAGLLGVEILYNPAVNFHYSAMVYVSIEIYDQAPVPNIILTEYWFKVVPDFGAPYVINEDPSRGEEDISIDTNIQFDIMDNGVGVNIDTLDFYIEGRYAIPSIQSISGGYRVSYDPPVNFFYGDEVEISIRVCDASPYSNVLRDTWKFYCVGSSGPWFDQDSFYPRPCDAGLPKRIYPISFNVYELDSTGLDRSSILVNIGGKRRNVTITPIVYRLG